MEKVFEVRIMHKDSMPEYVRRQIVGEVARRSADFQNRFKGFVKVTYVTASPKKISSIEPIEGNIIDYFHANKREGVVIPEF